MTMIHLWGRRQMISRYINNNTTRQKTKMNGTTSCRVLTASYQPSLYLLPNQHLTTSRNINTTATTRASTQSHSIGVMNNNQILNSKIKNHYTRYASSMIFNSRNRHITTTTTSPQPPLIIHPHTPLTASEILRTSSTIKSHFSPDPIRFVAITLHEHSPDQQQQQRHAEVIILHPRTGLASTLLVDLSTDTIASTTRLPRGTQPMFSPDDCDLAEEIVQNDPKMREIMRERYGIEDMTRVACDPWSVNFGGEEDEALVEWRKSVEGEDGDIPGRLVQTFLYHRQNGPLLEDNHYAHPIDILPVVDLHARRVVHVHGDLSSPPPPIPSTPVNYHRDLVSKNTYLPSAFRTERLAPLHVVQPSGPSFVVSFDDVVSWQKWKFRVGFNYREGLVLHDVSYDGRMIMKRGSLVEMAVPYGDPNQPFQRKCAFDVGDYGLGYCANSLELGCDCLGHIHYFDAILSNSEGEPVEKKKVVCMHEEDAGILWKHVEYRNGHNETRRSRELIISFIATVVNYEYLFYWHLKQDGCIEFNIKLSGELSTNTLSPSERSSSKPTHGTIVTPDGVNAQIHQHMFCARLDMAVDGPLNTVSEVDIVPDEPNPIRNPYGNAFSVRETPLKTEREAIRTIDPSRARTWAISSTKINPITDKATAYKLIPFARGPAQPTLLTSPSCRISQKGAFAKANLWVTPHSPTERYPAGEYTVQGDGSDGLPHWTSRNRSVEEKELVLWHSFGVCHMPRTEDFPVMPVEVTGFVLKPEGFFVGNPGVDLGPEVDERSELSAGGDEGCCARE